MLAFDADVLDGGDATSTITVHLSASAYDDLSLHFCLLNVTVQRTIVLSPRISGGRSPSTKKDVAKNLPRDALTWA